MRVDENGGDSPESVWHIVNGHRIHVRVAGEPSSPDVVPVVLVHGLGVSSRYFMPTQRLLAHQFRVFALDLPGFGRSDKPLHVLNITELADVLADWLELHCAGRAALVGNSLGCQVIVDLAMRRPELVECAVLNGLTTDPSARSATRQFLRLLMDIPREHPRLVPLVVRDYWTCGFRRMLLTLRHGLRDRVEEKLPHLSMPVMIVSGTRDPIVPPRWAAQAAALLPHGCLKVLHGSAHAAIFSTPGNLAHVISPFLANGAHCEASADLEPKEHRSTCC